MRPPDEHTTRRASTFRHTTSWPFTPLIPSTRMNSTRIPGVVRAWVSGVGRLPGHARAVLLSVLAWFARTYPAGDQLFTVITRIMGTVAAIITDGDKKRTDKKARS